MTSNTWALVNPAARKGLHFLFGDPAPLFNHRPGEIAEHRQPPVVDRLAVANGIDGLLRRARLGRHHAVGRHAVGAAVVDADGKGKEVLFGGRQATGGQSALDRLIAFQSDRAFGQNRHHIGDKTEFLLRRAEPGPGSFGGRVDGVDGEVCHVMFLF